ncbi:hypothetical protein TNCV_458141 [Trichonephila clavipes]|nr:hypothetical protein TNCV_458141 [Trichonephila clavipes]
MKLTVRKGTHLYASVPSTSAVQMTIVTGAVFAVKKTAETLVSSQLHSQTDGRMRRLYSKKQVKESSEKVYYAMGRYLCIDGCDSPDFGLAR